MGRNCRVPWNVVRSGQIGIDHSSQVFIKQAKDKVWSWRTGWHTDFNQKLQVLPPPKSPPSMYVHVVHFRDSWFAGYQDEPCSLWVCRMKGDLKAGCGIVPPPCIYTLYILVSLT